MIDALYAWKDTTNTTQRKYFERVKLPLWIVTVSKSRKLVGKYRATDPTRVIEEISIFFDSILSLWKISHLFHKSCFEIQEFASYRPIITTRDPLWTLFFSLPLWNARRNGTRIIASIGSDKIKSRRSHDTIGISLQLNLNEKLSSFSCKNWLEKSSFLF